MLVDDDLAVKAWSKDLVPIRRDETTEVVSPSNDGVPGVVGWYDFIVGTLNVRHVVQELGD